MTEQTDGTEIVRILSGINSINFYEGYDPKTGIFDKRKTNMGETGGIYCFTDGNGTRPDINDTVTKDLMEYTVSQSIFRRGEKFIMSGLVHRNELGPGEYSYMVRPELKVDKLFKYVDGLFVRKRIIDVSDRL